MPTPVECGVWGIYEDGFEQQPGHGSGGGVVNVWHWPAAFKVLLKRGHRMTIAVTNTTSLDTLISASLMSVSLSTRPSFRNRYSRGGY